MKTYLVTIDSRKGDHGILGPFSTKEKAVGAVKEYLKGYRPEGIARCLK